MSEDPIGLHGVMEQDGLRIEPLEEGHRESLRQACLEDEDIWQIYAVSYGEGYFDTSFGTLLSHPGRLPFAIFVDGELAGMTSWIDPDFTHLTAEIGNTYLRPRFRGGRINGLMKQMLFAHGFDCGLKRIQLTVDMRNERSQAACLKVGAVFEGAKRNHLITWTGHERDSAVFSVVEGDREKLGL